MTAYLPPAKASVRAEQNSRTRAAWVHAVEFLKSQGWGVRELARYMSCAPSMICEMQKGSREVAPWAIGGLPPEGKQAFSAAFQSLDLGVIRAATG